uniref:Uncharacterized protein n=1 Tax=Glossina austeni TaxID=7395 RepID=A0A1A9VCN7_GLOAU
MHITHVRLRNSVRATKTKRKASHLSIIYINNNDDDSNNNNNNNNSKEGRQSFGLSLASTFYPSVRVCECIWQPNEKGLTEIVEKHFERSLPEESTSLSIIRVMSK